MQEQANKEQVLSSLADSLAAPGGDSSSEDDDEDEKKDQAGKPGADILETHVDSKLLDSAFNRLRKRDLREKRSACYIQRRWKRKQKAQAVSAAQAHAKRLSAAKSKFVHAPAYFGESCLWVPLADWDGGDPVRYPYSACCETRGEFVYIPRSAVKDIIDKFSPWLADRFEFFRETVVKNMNSAEESAGLQADSVPKVALENAATKQPNAEATDAQVEGAATGTASGTGASATKTDQSQSQPAPSPEKAASQCPAIPVYYGPEDGPPGRPNYEAMAAMSYSVSGSYGSSVGSPLTFAMPHMKVSAGSTRSFRQAAAAAVARVAAHVTPPSAQQTPTATPRPVQRTPVGTPRSSRLQPGSVNSRQGLSEPLLDGTPMKAD